MTFTKTVFEELMFSQPVSNQCCAYLAKYFSAHRDEQPMFLKMISFPYVHGCEGMAFSLGERHKALDIIKTDAIDPFVRLWLAFLPKMLPSKLLRGFSNRLAVMAYGPFRADLDACEAISALHRDDLVTARFYAERVMNQCYQRKCEQAAGKAFYSAMLNFPFDAAVRSIGYLVEAADVYEVNQGKVIAACSQRLLRVCKMTRKKSERRKRGKQDRGSDQATCGEDRQE